MMKVFTVPKINLRLCCRALNATATPNLQNIHFY